MGALNEVSIQNLSSLDNSELFEFVVAKGNGVKGLVDTGITSIPARYVHPPEDRINPKTAIDSYPYLGGPIDLSQMQGDKKDETAKSLCNAASKLGFFQVINHGIPIEVLERIKKAAHNFFTLPTEKKSMYLKTRTPCPTVFYGTSFSPENEKSLEWKDYLSMILINDEDTQFWPDECRDAALEYVRTADKMIYTLMHTLLSGLGVEVDETALKSYMEVKACNLNYYPPCPNPELTVGVGNHSDLAALTILLQDDIGGLYVKVEDEKWIEIPPIDGALVINVGDTLEILSNGRYKSAEHRVLASSTRARVSAPIFVSPIPPTMIGPLPGLTEKDGKVVYRQLLFAEYKDKYFSAGHQGKNTLDFAKPLV